MENGHHNLQQLFDQLGLASNIDDIDRFIESHKPVATSAKLYELPFFSHSQQSFLQQALAEDADWSEIIDTLDSLLRQDADIRPS